MKAERPAARHCFVFTERIQRSSKTRDMDSIAHHNSFSVEAEYCCVFAKNGKFVVVT